jgi:hypothetical protein
LFVFTVDGDISESNLFLVTTRNTVSDICMQCYSVSLLEKIAVLLFVFEGAEEIEKQFATERSLYFCEFKFLRC